jgi:ABC-2 type transport system permease protein
MLYLLQLEWKKVRKYNVFIVLSLAYILLLPSLYLIGKRIPELPEGLMSPNQFYEFPTVWGYLGYTGNWLVFFFLGFMSVLLITMEFGTRTLRQNIITGLERSDIFKAKVIFIIAISAAATLYFALVGFTFGFLHTDVTSFSLVMRDTGIIGRYFLMCLSYMAFGFMIGLLIRRTGISIFLYFSYILFIERIIRWLIHFNIVRDKSMHFYPINATIDLVPVPISKQAEGFASENGFNLFLSPTEAVITTTIFMILFLLASWKLLQKRDL